MDFLIETLRPALVSKAAQIWHEGWMDAHAAIVPSELTKQRSLESFEIRMKGCRPLTRVAMQGEQPLGLVMVKGDELYQMYVGANARGKGVAQALMQDAETQLREAGQSKIWLACAVGNERAARFYSKMGWINACTQTVEMDTLDAPFPLQVWRFEKSLTRAN